MARLLPTSGTHLCRPLNLSSLQGWVFNVIPWLVAIPSSLFSGCLSDHLISQGREPEEQIREWLSVMKQMYNDLPDSSVDLHRLRYRLREEDDAGTIPDGCHSVCLLSVPSHCGLYSAQSKVYKCPLYTWITRVDLVLDCFHSFLC